MSVAKRNHDDVPDWPLLTPLVPSADLVMDTILDQQIRVVRRLFTTTLCKTLVSFLSSLPLVTTPGKPRKGEATRVNDRFQVEDAEFASRLWNHTSLKDLVDADKNRGAWNGEVLGLNPNIRIYRYSPGQFFDRHYDDSNKLEFGKEQIPAKTTWTLLIYLTTCEGGKQSSILKHL